MRSNKILAPILCWWKGGGRDFFLQPPPPNLQNRFSEAGRLDLCSPRPAVGVFVVIALTTRTNSGHTGCSEQSSWTVFVLLMCSSIHSAEQDCHYAETERGKGAETYANPPFSHSERLICLLQLCRRNKRNSGKDLLEVRVGEGLFVPDDKAGSIRAPLCTRRGCFAAPRKQRNTSKAEGERWSNASQ